MILLLHAAPVYGAVEDYVRTLADALREDGREAALAFPDVPELEPLRAAAHGTVRPVPYPPGVLATRAPALVRRFAALVRQLRPDVVHVTDVWPAGQVAARLAGVRRILVTHHTPELPRRDSLAGRALWALGWLARPEVIYTSDADRRSDSRWLLRTHVVPLGIDGARFANAARALPPDGPLVGTVGRLAEQKGQRFLLEAAPRVLERHPSARFVLVGDGELRTELEALAARLGLGDRVLFTGRRDDVPELLASFDVFAMPSLYEGLCLAVIEAQAAGVPVVATPVGGIRETVVPGETGVRVPPRDAQALADAIVSLLDDRDAARRLAEAARERATQYTRERMVRETFALYESAKRG